MVIHTNAFGEGFQNQETGGRSQETEVRRQKSEDRSQVHLTAREGRVFQKDTRKRRLKTSALTMDTTSSQISQCKFIPRAWTVAEG
jgi:ribosomal protein L16 Arg81 hydroxylase